MDNVNYILFLCVTIPLLLMLFLTDRDHRTGLTFMVIGIVLCLIVSELNGFFLRLFGGDLLYVTTTVTPMTEELVKALPVLFFALLISDDSRTLVTVSMAVGIGFAVLENLIILVGNVENVTLSWAFVRGLSSGLMHGVCTALVGMGMSMVRKPAPCYIRDRAAHRNSPTPPARRATFRRRFFRALQSMKKTWFLAVLRNFQPQSKTHSK